LALFEYEQLENDAGAKRQGNTQIILLGCHLYQTMAEAAPGNR
jgi:hypothetical protein